MENLNSEFNEKRIHFTGNTDLSTWLAIPISFRIYKWAYVHCRCRTSKFYIAQKNASSRLPVNATEICQFTGIILFMWLYRYPNVRSHWGTYGFDHIQQTMTANKFEKVGYAINFNDNEHPKHDRLHKITSIVEHLNKLFMNIIDEKLSLVDQSGPIT